MSLIKQIDLKWHDLRKNPKALPRPAAEALFGGASDDVLVCTNSGHYYIAYCIKNRKGVFEWKDATDFSDVHDVIAWKYIEHFEEDM